MAVAASSSGKRRSFNTDLDHLRKCFNAVDSLKSGFIGLEELTKLVNSMPHPGDSVVAELMEKLDRDKDGKVSFDDFMWLYELERELASKKQKLAPLDITNQSPSSPGNRYIESSPTSPNDMSYNSDVVLRRNPRRMTLPARLNRHGRELSLLSPIASHNPQKRPPSSDVTDLASQMRYLTDANESTDSPQLKRSSKVLSWIESEDLFYEDTGTGLRGEEELPSPPLSPAPVNEASQIGSILESVCNTKEVTSAAIAKLCDHVKADPQEQQELLALLHHLDKDGKGYVNTTEFAHGLQAIKNAVAVGSVTPTHQAPHRKGFREITPPKLSEPFGTPQGSKPPPFSSTPMVHSARASILTELDPEQNGYVKIDDVVSYWQSFGIETPHNRSLENILSESLPADPSGRISVGELTATLEGSMVAEGKSQNVLRQVALKSFKNEILTLRTQVHQVSMERDKLKTSLNRTVEEKTKLIAEGDEHVETITKKSEKEKRRQQAKYLERIKEVEKTKQEESLQLQERATNAIRDLEIKLKELKREEEKLREDLKFANEDVEEMTKQLTAARKEIGIKDRAIAVLQKDLGSRSEHDIFDDESHMQHANELETELAEKVALVSELQDKLREVQDDCDELKAENERMRQKNIAQKRSMQKSRSVPNTRNTSARKRSNRPLSGSHFHRRSSNSNPRVPTSNDYDLAVQHDHPVLREEGQEEEEEVDTGPLHLPSLKENVSENDSNPPQSDEDTTDTEDDVFAKSSASLMEEFHQEKLATLERKRSNYKTQFELQQKKHEETVAQMKQQIFRLEEFSESQQEQALKMEEEKAMVMKSLKALKYELESERQSHEVEVNILSRKLDNAENDAARINEDLLQAAKERELVREDYEAKLSRAEKKAEAEVSVLYSKLENAHAEYSSLQVQLSQVKEKLEAQKREFIRKSSDALAKLESKHMEQTKATRSKHKTVVENLQKELHACKEKEKNVRDQLNTSGGELEAKVGQLEELKLKEVAYKRKILAFETTESQYINEVSQLQASITELEAEISQMKSAAVAHRSVISELKSEKQKDSEYSAERLAYKRACAQKDEQLVKLQAVKELQKRLITGLVSDASKNIASQIDSLQSNCGVSLVRYSSQLEDALLKLAAIAKSLDDKDTQHASALRIMLSDLDHKHKEISSCKAEIGQLQHELATSHHSFSELTESQEQLQREREKEMYELQSKLEQALNRDSSAPSDKISPRHVTVDAGSGQVISEHNESPTRQQEFLQKEQLISSLHSEIEQLKQAERLANLSTEEANRKLVDKEEEVKQTKLEVQSLHKKTRELEIQLELQAHESNKCMEEIATLKNSLASARTELAVSENLHKKTMSEINDKHASELQSAQEEVGKNTSEARELYNYLLESSIRTKTQRVTKNITELNHSQAITETQKEVDVILKQFEEQQHMYVDLETTLAEKIEEHEAMEAQFTAEHEEEVRALRQQKHQLMNQLEECQKHYRNILEDQEQQNEDMFQELTTARGHAEKQLKEKAEESFHAYQHMADLSEEKKVLIDIIKQLCVESGRQIIHI